MEKIIYDRVLMQGNGVFCGEDGPLLFAPANVRPASIRRNIFGQMVFNGNGVGIVCDLIETTSRSTRTAPPRDLDRFRVYVQGWFCQFMREYEAERKRTARGG